MIFRQKWICRRKSEESWFDACVPGNVQKDYAIAMNWGDINYKDNCKRYLELEDESWIYRTELFCHAKECERVYFVSGGIDYQYDILINCKKIASREGMFTPVRIDITDFLTQAKNILEIEIAPHPKREGALADRSQADQCCKPPVSYGWDWHPRVIPSGIWNDAYIETENPQTSISCCEVFYMLSEDFSNVQVHFEAQSCTEDSDAKFVFEMRSMEGEIVYQSSCPDFVLQNPKLWWCNGQGEPYLYQWSARYYADKKSGTVGFRKVELVMNKGAWKEPKNFPKTRSCPPATICLNGRNIFAKGSNWVTPEIFTGSITEDTYLPLVTLARDAHMNIFRCWGGAGTNKDAFYEICDKMGIMVWQEFPLACNNYVASTHYMKILEQESCSIVRNLRKYACMVLWCGGNELFNAWSKMTDQSLALRLLNKICYEEDRNTPFIATSPLMGMAHGNYQFFSDREQMDVYGMFNNAKNTAYTEFGVPGLASYEYLKTFIPPEELKKPTENTSWETHHAFGAWVPDTWLCTKTLQKYFGAFESTEKLCEQSAWLQTEGYKAIFEEARRQKPYCSMAVNWCYNEPWKTAANNSLISYPTVPKAAYYGVADALRPVMPSARLATFSYTAGDIFKAELWLLNDSSEKAEDVIRASVEIGGQTYFLLEWKTGNSGENSNLRGHKLQFELPDIQTDRFLLKLESKNYTNSSYLLKYTPLMVTEKLNLLNI